MRSMVLLTERFFTKVQNDKESRELLELRSKERQLKLRGTRGIRGTRGDRAYVGNLMSLGNVESLGINVGSALP